MERIRYVDSHTGGEPTRLVIEGFPDLSALPLRERVAALRSKHDRYRRAVCTEPRASDVVVGGVLMPPVEKGSVASVIYFNNAGYLGMCGHGTIGVIATLQHLGHIESGIHRLDTPVGTVTCTLAGHGEVSIENVVSYRLEKGVAVDVEGFGRVTGDIAWGGNWFYLVDGHGLQLARSNIEALTEYAWDVRRALAAQGHPEVDHVELFGAASSGGADSKSFVLCPGKAYDRSPCGTGTSAKLACLAADGKLEEGATWVQESIIGSTFTASYRWLDRERGVVVPSIGGRAYVTGEASLVFDDDDPYCWGIA